MTTMNESGRPPQRTIPKVRKLFRLSILNLLLVSTALVGAGGVGYVGLHKIENYRGDNLTVRKLQKWLRPMTDRPALVIEQALAYHEDPGLSSPLPKILLRISAENYAELLAHLPESGRDYKTAYVTPVGFDGVAEEEIKLKARLRGYGAGHWAFEKKSWRLRFPKTQLLDGTRKLNLINPKSASMLNESMATWLAQRLELLTPDMQLVKFYVNGEYYGVMLAVEQPDEHFLARHGRPPGNIYGEIEDSGVPLFASLHGWQKYSNQTGLSQSDFSDLNLLLEVFRIEDDATFEREIGAILDLHSFYRWHAISDIFESYHQDHWHNNRLYFDPTHGFQFMIWDLQAFFPYTDPHELTNPLVLRILACPSLRAEYQQVLQDIVFDEDLEQELIDEFERRVAESRADILADRRKSYSFSVTQRTPFSNSTYKRAVHQLRSSLQQRFGELRAEFGKPAPVHGTLEWTTTAKGGRTLTLSRPASENLHLSKLLLALSAEADPDTHGAVQLHWDSNRNAKLDANEQPVARAEWDEKSRVLSFDLGGLRLPPLDRDVPLGAPTDAFFVATDGPGFTSTVLSVEFEIHRRVADTLTVVPFDARIVHVDRAPTLPEFEIER